MRKVVLCITILFFLLCSFFVLKKGEIISYPQEDLIFKQSEVDNEISDFVKDSTYTIDNPKVLKNPYFISPLTALIIFSSEREITVQVLVNDEIIKEITGTSFIIPIVYLVEGISNKIDLVENGNTYTYYIETEAISNGIISVVKKNKFNVLASSTKMKHFMMNGEGKLIWYLDLDTQGLIEPITRDSFLIGTEESVYLNNTSYFTGIYEVDYLGKIRKRIDTPYGYHHEIKYIGDDKALILGTKNQPMDVLYELDLSNGNIVNEINIYELLSTGNKDIVSYLDGIEHGIEANSVDYLDGKVLLSLRNINTILEFNYEKREINYVITSDKFLRKSLSKYVICNDITLSGEHNAKYIDEHTISFYNNGYDHLTGKATKSAGMILDLRNKKTLKEYTDEKKYSYAFGSIDVNNYTLVNYPYMYKGEVKNSYTYDAYYTNLITYKDKKETSKFKIKDNLYRALKFDIKMSDKYEIDNYQYYGYNFNKTKLKIKNVKISNEVVNLTNNSIEIFTPLDNKNIEVYFKGNNIYSLKYRNTKTYFSLPKGKYQVYIKINDDLYRYKDIFKFS